MGIDDVFAICRENDCVKRQRFTDMRFDDLLIDISSVWFSSFLNFALKYWNWRFRRAYISFVGSCKALDAYDDL